jgi:Calcineurin-like phosphoesterase
MKMLFVADLHYTLKQFDWLMANATNYDPIVIGGDLLDLTSALDADIQILVIEKYLYRLRQQTRVVVCSGNHDLDSCNAAGEAVAGWLHDVKAENLIVDGSSVELSGVLLTVCPWWDGLVSQLTKYCSGLGRGKKEGVILSDFDGALNEKVQKTSTFPFLDKSLAGVKPTHFTVSEQVEQRSHSIRMYPFL